MTNHTSGASQPQFAFFQGEVVPLEDARVSVMTQMPCITAPLFSDPRTSAAIGSARPNPEGEVVPMPIDDSCPACTARALRHEHYLHLGCRMLMLDIPYSVDDLCDITVDLVQKNANRSDVYIRPLAYKSEELVANLKLHEIASDFTLIVVPFGNYLGTENLRCCTSSWRRLEDQMTPTQIKTSANYLNSILAKTEAVLAGFDEAILLNQDGHVAEGSGENLFMMRKGKLITPVLEDNPLPGITRDTVMELAREDLGIEVVERRIDRTELYLADEVFLSGTAAHLTPVISLDSRPIADGNPGPVSTALKQMYFDIVFGRNPKYLHWCTAAIPNMVAA